MKTRAIYKMIIAIDSYFKKNISEEDFKLAGIHTFVAGNYLAIMSATYNKKKYDLDSLFSDIIPVIKKQNINLKKIRYFIIGNWSGDLNGKHGEAIAITGHDLASNIDNLDALSQNLIRLKDGQEYPKDPSLFKIIRYLRGEMSFSKTHDETLVATIVDPNNIPY